MAQVSSSTSFPPSFGSANQSQTSLMPSPSAFLYLWTSVSETAAGGTRVNGQPRGGYLRLAINSRAPGVRDVCNQNYGHASTDRLLFATRKNPADASINLAVVDPPGLLKTEIRTKALNFKDETENSGRKVMTLYAFFMPFNRFSSGLFSHAGCCLSTRLPDDLLMRLNEVVQCRTGQDIISRHTRAAQHVVSTVISMHSCWS